MPGGGDGDRSDTFWNEWRSDHSWKLWKEPNDLLLTPTWRPGSTTQMSDAASGAAGFCACVVERSLMESASSCARRVLFSASSCKTRDAFASLRDASIPQNQQGMGATRAFSAEMDGPRAERSGPARSSPCPPRGVLTNARGGGPRSDGRR